MSSPPVAFTNPASANGENALTESIRAKYPGAYDDMNGAQLTRAILDKFPQYHDLAVQPPSGAQQDQSLAGKALSAVHSSIAAGNQELNKSTDDQGNLLSLSTRFAHGLGRLAMIPANMADTAAIKPFADPKATEQIFGPQPSGMFDPVGGYQHYLAHQFVLDPAKQQFQKAGEDYRRGNYSEMAGHGLAGALPVVGPAAAGVGERLGTGDVAGASLDALPLASMSPTFRGIAGKGLNAITPNEPIFNFDFSKVPGDIGSALRSTPAKAIGTAGAAADAFFTGHPGVGTGIAAFGYPRISSLFNKAANFVDPNPLTRPLMPNIRPGAGADAMADSFAGRGEPSAAPPLLALPPGPIQLNAAEPPPTQSVFPAARQVVRDPVTGRMKTQFLTSPATPGEPVPINTPQALRGQLVNKAAAMPPDLNLGGMSDVPTGRMPATAGIYPETMDNMPRLFGDVPIDRFQAPYDELNNWQDSTAREASVQSAMNRPGGPWRGVASGQTQPRATPLDVPGVSPLDRPLVNAPRGVTQPVPESTAPIVGPDPNFRPSILKQGNPVTQSPPRVLGSAGQYLMDEPIINERPEVPAVGESLEDRLMRSIQQAEAKKRRAGVGR